MLDKAWPIIEPWLEAAMQRGARLYEPDDVREACEHKEMLLWVAIDSDEIIGMTVTSLQKYPRMTIAAIKWGGGRLGRGREWLLPMVATLRQWAEHEGAEILMGGGRKGWLHGFGFRDAGVIFAIDVTQ